MTPLPEHQEIGTVIASLLNSPHCPESLRKALNVHLRELFQEADLARPEIVRAIYAYLVLPPAAAPTATTTNGNGAAKTESELQTRETTLLDRAVIDDADNILAP